MHMQLCTLNEIRDQAELVRKEREVRELNRHVVSTLESKLKQLGLDGCVANNGSTNEDRMTYVFDPNGEYLPFPPDVDLKMGVYPQQRGEEALLELFRPFVSLSHVHRFRGSVEATWRKEGFAVSLSVSHLERGQRIITYSSGEWALTEEQKRDIRALKLILQRSGAYGGYNHGINGIAIEQLIRMYGGLEAGLGFLAGASRSAASRTIMHPDGKENLLRRVSRFVWKRVADALDIYLKTGKVYGQPFGTDAFLYSKMNPWSMDCDVECSPLACGTPPVEIATHVCKALGEILEVKNPIDYYIVPVNGRVGFEMCTRIYAAYPCQEHLGNPDIVKMLGKKMREFEKRTQRFLRNSPHEI